MSNIHNYPNEAFQINDEDFYDVDYWNGAAWETRKISGLTLKTILGGLPPLAEGFIWQGDISGEAVAVPLPASVDTNIYSDSGTLTAARFVSLGGFTLFFSDTEGTTKFTGGNILDIQANAGQEALIRLLAGNGENRGLEFTDQGDNRWKFIAADLEAGANSGTNFKIERYDDAGVLISVPFHIDRATGAITFNEEYNFPVADGNANEVLTTDGLGNLTFQPAAVAIQDLADVIGVDANTGLIDIIVNTVASGIWKMQTDNIDPTKQIALLFVDGGAGNDCIKITQENAADRLGGFGIWDQIANLQGFYINANDFFQTQITSNGYQFVVGGAATGQFLISHELTFKIGGIGTANDISLTMPIATADRFQTFQDKDGEIALKSDTQEKFIHHSYAYDMSLAAGYLWNTVNVAAASLTSFNESYRAIQFAGVGGADGCFINATLPSYYPSNTTVKVTINFTTDGTGGDVRFYMGLQKPNGANYGDDTTTEWKFFTFTANAGLPTGSNTLLFNGTGLTALLPISVKVFRDPGDVNDTYNGDAFVTNLLIEIV